MCVANSARSQMAEGLAKKIFGKGFCIESAGSSPKSINPLAIAVMSEIGIDISTQYSKSFEQISPKFTDEIDYIFTLCAEEVCPTINIPKAKKIHWGFPDPATPEIDKEKQLQVFREVRAGIEIKIRDFSLTL